MGFHTCSVLVVIILLLFQTGSLLALDDVKDWLPLHPGCPPIVGSATVEYDLKPLIDWIGRGGASDVGEIGTGYSWINENLRYTDFINPHYTSKVLSIRMLHTFSNDCTFLFPLTPNDVSLLLYLSDKKNYVHMLFRTIRVFNMFLV